MIGKNLYTVEGFGDGQWNEPQPGLSVKPEIYGYKNNCVCGICIGHQVDHLTCAVTPEFYENEKSWFFAC